MGEGNGADRGSAWDNEVDVVVVGSGGGGMTAALAAKAAGLEPLVIEKAEVFGGTTAMSGGGVWIPNAPEFKRLGEHDDPQKILDYLIAIAGERVDHKRLARYVEAAPQMMAFLEEQSPYLRDAFFWSRGYSDYHPDKGGNPLGRGLYTKPIDSRTLGEIQPELRAGQVRIPGLPAGMWLTGLDLRSINRIRWGVDGIGPYKTLFRLIWRVVRYRLLGERMVANGAALATRLRLALRDKDVSIRLRTPMRELILEEGRVVGVLAEHRGTPIRIRSRRGVLIASGGFENNPEMRAAYQPSVGKGWSIANPDSNGDGIRAGEAVGAAVDLMDDAWWFPVFALPGLLFSSVTERQYPGQFIVNHAGKRFVNEATPYNDFGHAQIAGHETGVGHIPAWMIIDSQAWRRNIICGHFPGAPMPKEWVESGMVKKADRIVELAEQIGVPPDALEETAERYNGFARQGKDEDFHRGESAFDNWYADPSFPNPNLADVARPPFYAFQIFPGDLGTNGGLLTDENARVLREDGAVIEGLYACGNASASVMGNSYAGQGATIGAAMTFGWVAARHMADIPPIGDIEPTSSSPEQVAESGRREAR